MGSFVRLRGKEGISSETNLLVSLGFCELLRWHLTSRLLVIVRRAEHFPRFFLHAAPPMFSIAAQDSTVPEWSDIFLRCTVANVPPPAIHWYYPRSISKSKVEIVSAYNTSTLRVRHAVHSDRGLYVCSASNEVGLAEAVASVSVPGMTVFRKCSFCGKVERLVERQTTGSCILRKGERKERERERDRMKSEGRRVY